MVVNDLDGDLARQTAGEIEGETLDVYWQGPATSRALVPASALTDAACPPTPWRSRQDDLTRCRWQAAPTSWSS